MGSNKIQLISMQEAALRIGINYHALARRIYRGKVKAIKDGQNVFLPITEVERLAQIKRLQESI